MSTFFIIAYYFCALNLVNKGLLIFHFRSRLETFYCRLAYQQKLVIAFFSFRSKKNKSSSFCGKKILWWNVVQNRLTSIGKSDTFYVCLFLSKFKLSEIFPENDVQWFSLYITQFIFEFAWMKMLFVSFGSFY